MKALIIRELQSFFGSVVGYLVIGIFLLLNGLFLWYIDSPYNVLQSGYNDLSPYFSLAPWLLLFLIPAVTMRIFSDEMRLGTIELLMTKPLSLFQIVLGKYLGAVLLFVIALIPTFLYTSINGYALDGTSIDWSSTIGSFVGLFLLAAAYTSIGVCTSALSENQIVCFLLAVVGCALFYFGFDVLSNLSGLSFIERLGMQSHFESLSKGVIDSRDVVYFASFIAVFLLGTTYLLNKKRN
ncbi:gliding motility-associated ABC transporter permease subunit GldF [Capnocytophaga sp. ARDL2]|uniref:gliding motility-associated ABC transporter permease subunit GldF n=1 Tax=Capnocytophaga sp. ARDL2 TaxID=3238809 RepID=UPI00355844F5